MVKIEKNLIGIEDILFGEGTVTQTRGGQDVTITKFNAKEMPYDNEQTLEEAIQNQSSVLINDNEVSDNTIYSSTKIETIHDEVLINAENIDNLATAQAEFGNDEDLILTTSEQVLAFNIIVPSTDDEVMELDATTNTVLFKINASFNFRTDMTFEFNTNQARTITIKGKKLADDTEVYSRTLELEGQMGNKETVVSNKLLTVGKNGIPAEPLEMYFTIACDGTGITLNSWLSNLASGSSYDLTTTKAFTELEDTPNSFTGQAGKLVTVAKDETNLEFTKVGGLNISSQLNGDFSLSNTVTTLGFNAYTYTGQTTVVNGTYYTGVAGVFDYAVDTLRNGDFYWNSTGSTQTINVYDAFNFIVSTVDVADQNGYLNTGISSVDFTQPDNGSGYWLDRSSNDIRTDAGAVMESGEVEVNTSKVHIKDRVTAYSNQNYDGIRGVGKGIQTDLTAIEYTDTQTISAFASNGFTVGTNITVNISTHTYIAYQTLYTHMKWGTTNQGKFQIEAYNPVTNEGMIYYIGSGVDGHQISHSQGVEIDYRELKTLDEVSSNWMAYRQDSATFMYLNTATADTAESVYGTDSTTDIIELKGSHILLNGADQEYIMYYKCKSETFTIGTYTGTGASGNFIETKDVNGVARKPRRVIAKRIDAVGNWHVEDSERGDSTRLFLNLSSAEDNAVPFTINNNGFTLGDASGEVNASGGQYIYLVEFDTNADNNGSYFDKATDTTNLQLADGLFSISKGFTASGVDNSIVTKTGTITPNGGWIND